jgi:hypothetical protein
MLRSANLTRLGLLGFVGTAGVLLEYAWLEPLQLFYLFFLWPLIEQTLLDESDNPADWIEGADGGIGAFVSALTTVANPFVQWQAIRQGFGHLVIGLRHCFDLPDPESFTQRGTYRLPVEDVWTVVNGSIDRRHSHSWEILGQRYAYDLVITDEEGRSYADDGRDLTDYYCFGEAIVAPAAGRVVAARDGHRDFGRLGFFDPLQRDIFGNYVIVEHAEGEFGLYAHLQRESVAVAEGDHVERGQLIGRCGSSGNSTEPHLHFHFQDHPNPYHGMGLPVAFDSFKLSDAPDSVPPSNGPTYLSKGQRVAHRDRVG